MPPTFMESDLARSGLVPSDLDAIETFDSFSNASRYRIPYFYPNGTPHPLMYRERLSNPAPNGGKYHQPDKATLVAAGHPASDASYPYFNRRLLRNTTWAHLAALGTIKTWVLAEGEKKATCIGKYCMRPAIGIGGCWNGLYAEDDKLPALHPALAMLFQPGQRVEIVLDADMFTNKHVNLAAGTLRRVLRMAGLTPVFVDVPMQGGIDTWLLTLDPMQRAKAYDELPRREFNNGELQEHRQLLYHFLDLPLQPNGKVSATEHAVTNVLTKHERYKDRIWVEDTKDEMRESVSIGEPRPLVDSFVGTETAWMQEHIAQGFVYSRVGTALFSLASSPSHHRNAIREYVDALRWDGVPRVEEMFMRGWGAPNTTYTRAVGRAWLLSAVARAYRPGCDVQTMLVLEGAQGIGKSRSLRLIGGDWYIETATKMDSKDFILEAHRSWFFDLAELGAYKFADFSFAKALLSTAVDVLRAPYDRVATSKPRRFVIVATTNERQYLRDLTGNRRFWPMECTKIDLDWIRDNRDQLLAEAKVQLDSGEAWWIPDSITAAVQHTRVVSDPWEDKLAGVLAQVMQTPPLFFKGKPYYFVASATILQALEVSSAHAYTGHYQRISSLMEVYFPQWERRKYDNMNAPIMVNGVLQTKVNGYRLPITGALQPSNVIPIAPQA